MGSAFLLITGTGPSGPAHSNVYWSAPEPSDPWATVGNWWKNSGATIPLGRLPQAGDFIYLQGGYSPSSGPATQTVFSGFDTTELSDVLDNPNQGYGIVTPTISIGAGGILNMGTLSGQIQGWFGVTDHGLASATFQGYSQLSTTLPTSGTATFTVTFLDYTQSTGSGYVVNGPNVIFRGNSTENGVVAGNAEFHDNSYNTQSGAIVGNGYFYDNSQNYTDGSGYYGSVLGEGHFFDNSVNNGTVQGILYCSGGSQNNYIGYSDGYFTDNARNNFSGSLGGQGFFSGNGNNYGSLGTGNFSENSYNGGEISYGNFIDNSYNAGTLDSGGSFDNMAYNNGTAQGFTSFSGTSYNNQLCADDAAFYGSSVNSGSVGGSATFMNSSANYNDVAANADFYDTTNNYGTVEGVATFWDSANNQNPGGTTGGVVCNGSGTCTPA